MVVTDKNPLTYLSYSTENHTTLYFFIVKLKIITCNAYQVLYVLCLIFKRLEKRQAGLETVKAEISGINGSQ